MAGDGREDALGGRLLRKEAGGGADGEGKEEVRAHRVAEEELRHGERDVARGEAENPLSVGLGGEGVGAVALHDRLGAAGGAAGEEQDRRIVAMGPDGGEVVGDRAGELFERRAAGGAVADREQLGAFLGSSPSASAQVCASRPSMTARRGRR